LAGLTPAAEGAAVAGDTDTVNPNSF
jgi:hypothetical protein